MSVYWIALTEMLLCWALWLWPFLRRTAQGPRREASVTVSRARWGLLLQSLSYFLAMSVRLAPEEVGPGRLAVSMLCGPAAVALAWSGVRHLGKQWRINAGLYHDHELVKSGPYALVRHPIYASMLAVFLQVALLFTPWARLAGALALFLAGTEIRVRVEEGLLAERFGDAFAEYKRQVRAYVPFVR